MLTMTLFAFDYLCVSVTVSPVRYTKHCVDGQPSEHSFVANTREVLMFSRSMVETMPRPTLAIVNDFEHYPVPYVVQCYWMYC